jgi:hypothetical protein
MLAFSLGLMERSGIIARPGQSMVKILFQQQQGIAIALRMGRKISIVLLGVLLESHASECNAVCVGGDEKERAAGDTDRRQHDQDDDAKQN